MFGRHNTADSGVVEEVDERPGHVWSPAQAVSVILGIAAIVFGAIALADIGLDLGHVDGPHATVLGFHTTPLLALAEIGWGVLMVFAGMRPVAGRALMSLLGTAAITLGALILLDAWPNRLHDWFGVHDKNGLLMLAAGAITLVAAFVLPVVASPGRRVVKQRHVVSS